MTIIDLTNSVNFDSNIKTVDYGQKNSSKNSTSSFLNVLESANKSYNFSFDKTEKFSSKNLNQYNKNTDFKSKEFKSDYENFYNKLDNNKTTDNPIKQNYERKYEERSENHEKFSDENKEVSKNETKVVDKNTYHENKQEIKEKKPIDEQQNNDLSEENKAKTDLNSDKETVFRANEETTNEEPEEQKVVKVEDVNLNNSDIVLQNNLQNIDLNIQAALINNQDNNEALNKDTELNETADLNTSQVNNPNQKLQDAMIPAKKQILNEKANNSPAENVIQQAVKEKTSKILAQINPEETKKPAGQNQIENTKQEQAKKPEVLASVAVLNNLNAVDKNPVALAHSEKLESVSEKLAGILNNEDAKPVVTGIEIKNVSAKLDSRSQDKQQSQQDLKSNIDPVQTLLSKDENGLQKIELSKTSQFDKILNSKQAQNTENSVLNQLKDKLSSDIATNKSQITIALRPDNLGKVSINLVSEGGTLTAQITTESNHVKDILNKNLETLRQNMSEQGINVGKMVVDVKEPQPSNQNLNSDQNSRNFEQTNSNTSNMNHQSNKQNFSNEGSSAYLNNQSYEFEEESELSELNLAGSSSSIHAGKVDYKV